MPYELNEIVSKYQDQDYFDLRINLQKEILYVESVLSKSDNYLNKIGIDKYKVGNYYKHLKDLSFVLMYFQVPITTGKYGALLFKPIIQELVNKGQLLPSALDMYASL